MPKTVRTPFARHTLPAALAGAAAIGGAIVSWHYHSLGLALSHYDARGHLVVARRIFDSITPGWQQIGAVWLPLPHLLNAIPVQIDLFYRTGASAIALSVASFALACGSIAWIVQLLTGSRAAAIAALPVFALNPDVLYLQATPMTEPLLLALTTIAVALLMNACRPDGPAERSVRALPHRSIGIAFALACLTRYEAWAVTACALGAATWVLWRRGDSWPAAATRIAPVAAYPITAIVAFTIFSRIVVGQWFVGGDFFVPENKALGDPVMALKEIGWGLEALSGPLLVWIAAGGVAVLIWQALWTRDRAFAILPVALAATAVIPWGAFYKGHPFRIRYMVPLIAVEAVAGGALAGAVRRAHVVTATALLGVVAWELRPMDRSAPMVVEAQWDRPNRPARAAVTACLGAPGRGEKIMASMGSLGHYMQETAADGYAIHDFLHEGNGDIWLTALVNPRLFADWMLIEEKAEGGDMLARIAHERPSFLDGYTRVCEGAGLALYKRADGGALRAQNRNPTVTR